MFHEIEKADDQDPVKPFGICLREARESLGLSLEELSKTLNLKISILEALEKSEVNKLPPSLYVQGYIKAYTKALGISSEKIHVDYLKLVGNEQAFELKPRSTVPSESNSDSPIVKTISILFGALALSAILFGIYTYYSDKIDTIGKATLDGNFDVNLKIPLQKAAIVITQDARIDNDGTLVVGKSADPEIIEEITAEERVKEQAVARDEVPGLVEKIFNTDVASKQDLLIIKATEESWAEIRDDNKERIFFGMLQEDDFLILTGKAPFDVFLGNAVNINIEVNDVEVDMSDYIRANNIAHFKVSEKSNQIVFH